MSTNPKHYALQIKGMSLAELIKERNSLMDDIREIEEGIVMMTFLFSILKPHTSTTTCI